MCANGKSIRVVEIGCVCRVIRRGRNPEGVVVLPDLLSFLFSFSNCGAAGLALAVNAPSSSTSSFRPWSWASVACTTTSRPSPKENFL
jgi:hypothetical protein